MGFADHNWDDKGRVCSYCPSGAAVPAQDGGDLLYPILSEHVHILNWQESFAECVCPNPECGRPDARVFLDGDYPHIYCFSSHCADYNASVNVAVRAEVKERCGGRLKRNLTMEEKEIRRFKRHVRTLRDEFRRLVLTRIRAGAEYTQAALLAQAGLSGKESPVQQQRLMLGLFRPDSVIWIGNREDSGDSFWSVEHFHEAGEWLHRLPLDDDYQLICPSEFTRWERATQQGDYSCQRTYQRISENVSARRFFVYESDTLSPDDQLKVICHLSRKLRLRAAVYSGGKSVHAWFDQPRLTDYRAGERFKAMLQGLGADPGMIKKAGTTRFCGVSRFDDERDEDTGRMQRLLFINL